MAKKKSDPIKGTTPAPTDQGAPDQQRAVKISIRAEVTPDGKATPIKDGAEPLPEPGQIYANLTKPAALGGTEGANVRIAPATRRDELLMLLQMMLQSPKATEAQRAELAPIFLTLMDGLESLKIEVKGGKMALKYVCFEGYDAGLIEAALKSVVVSETLSFMVQATPQGGSAATKKDAGKTSKAQPPAGDGEPQGDEPQGDEPPAGETFRKSRAFVNQFFAPLLDPKGKQLDLFRDINPNAVNIGETVYRVGENATPEEIQILEALYILLHDKSERKNADSPDFYAGDADSQTHDVRGFIDGKKLPVQLPAQRAPNLYFSLYELAKAMKGGPPTGRDYTSTEKQLNALAQRRVLVSYSQKGKDRKGRDVTVNILTNEPLILSLSKADVTRDANGRTVTRYAAKLHPVFRHEIGKPGGFITYPRDGLRRMQAAWGETRMPNCLYKLRELITADQHRGYKEMTLDKLFPIIDLDGYVKRRKRAQAVNLLKRSAECLQRAGLLNSWKITDAATGGQKVVFDINKDFR